jgi:hypothetical protein
MIGERQKYPRVTKINDVLVSPRCVYLPFFVLYCSICKLRLKAFLLLGERSESIAPYRETLYINLLYIPIDAAKNQVANNGKQEFTYILGGYKVETQSSYSSFTNR